MVFSKTMETVKRSVDTRSKGGEWDKYRVQKIFRAMKLCVILRIVVQATTSQPNNKR